MWIHVYVNVLIDISLIFVLLTSSNLIDNFLYPLGYIRRIPRGLGNELWLRLQFARCYQQDNDQHNDDMSLYDSIIAHVNGILIITLIMVYTLGH